MTSFAGMNGRTTCAKIVITTGRDCGSAEWINTDLNFEVSENVHSDKNARHGAPEMSGVADGGVDVIADVTMINGQA